MDVRFLRLVAALFCVTIFFSSAAFAANCTPPCANTEASVRPTSVIPNPEDATKRGELFLGAITTLNLTGNASQEIALPFEFQIGSTSYNSLFVNENGLVSFGAPIATSSGDTALSFRSVNNLSQLGVPVIAPFYADLLSRAEPSVLTTADFTSYLGNVVVQYGTAIPYLASGTDFQPAVRITWYGLINNGDVNHGAPVFAQLLLTGDGEGTNSFHFSYGPPGSPGQAGDGSIAGFALGADAFQFTGPYVDGIPTYFELDNGRLVGPLATVPEPVTWAEILLGFVIIGALFRAKSARVRTRGILSPSSFG